MMACDMCGKVGEQYLAEVRPIYQTRDVKHVCDGCMSVLDKQLSIIQSSMAKAQCSLMQRFIANFKKHKQEEKGSA